MNKNKITWEYKEDWNKLAREFKDIVGVSNKYEDVDPIKRRISELERKMKLIEEFLNKFFDTEIDKKDK